MGNKSLYELGLFAQKGDEMAMLEILNRKKKILKKYSFRDENRYQFIILKLIEGIKNYKFKKFLKIFGRIQKNEYKKLTKGAKL